MSSRKYQIKNRIWISGKNGSFLGNGRVALLEAIQKTGSITKAAASLDMSYKKAWEQINAMNLEAKKPLVVKTSGGKGGGGTQVTPDGTRMIENFKSINKSCLEFLEDEFLKYDFT